MSVTELVTDGAPNIIPSTVAIRGDVRGYEGHVSQAIRSRMASIVEGAAAHGATATLRYDRVSGSSSTRLGQGASVLAFGPVAPHAEPRRSR